MRSVRRPILALTAATAAIFLACACGGGAGGAADDAEPDAVGRDADGPALGPVDGRNLPPTDTGRVAVGDAAPDFRLESYAGPGVALSDFRGKKDVVLVFYRGYW